MSGAEKWFNPNTYNENQNGSPSHSHSPASEPITPSGLWKFVIFLAILSGLVLWPVKRFDSGLSPSDWRERVIGIVILLLLFIAWAIILTFHRRRK